MHAVNVADSLGNSPELCEAWAKRASMHAMRCDFENAVVAANEAAAVATSLDLPFQTPEAKSRSAAMANLYLGLVETYQGRWERGSDFAQRAAAEFGACGDMLELATAHSVVSENLCYLGKLEEALSWANEGLDIIERTGAKQGVLELLVSRVSVLARLADTEALTTSLERLHALTSETEGLSKAAADAQSARYAMAAGEAFLVTRMYDDAVHNLEAGVKFVDRYSFIGTRPRWVLSYPLLALAYLKQHQRRELGEVTTRIASRRTVAKLIDKSYQWAEAFPSLMAPALLTDGMFLWRWGDQSAAREKLEESTRVAQQQGAPLLLADIGPETELLFAGS